MLGEKLGRFQGQLCSGAIEQIEIEYAGEAAELNVAPITVAVLKGLLESVTDKVNMVNAPLARPAARHQGDRVEVEPHAGLRQLDHDPRHRAASTA